MKPSRSLDPNLLEVEVVKKMNFRNIALVAALVSVTGVASAQSFRLAAGAGATLVGNTFVVAPSGNFEVEVWLDAASQGNITGASLVLSLAYDSTASTSGTPVRIDNKLNAVAGSDSLPVWSADTIARYTAPLTSGMTTGRVGAAPVAGNNQSGVGPRNVVWYVGRSGGNGSTYTGSTKIATFTFSHSIANGDTYGDSANENGLYVYDNGSTSTSVSGGSSGLSGAGAAGNFGSAKYAVQAVPEPATMTALGLGLAAIARRRRSSKK